MGHSIDPRSKSGATAPTDPDGVAVLVVRKDSTGAIDEDGDLTTLQVDADGALKVTGTASANSQYELDTEATGLENGQMIIAVRNDAGGSLVDADYDRAPLQVDADGALRVVNSASGPMPVTDDGGSLTVDGTVYAAQDGAWNVGLVSGVTLADSRSPGDMYASTDEMLPVAGYDGTTNTWEAVPVDSLTNTVPISTPTGTALPVQVDGVAAALPITDDGGSITVDGTIEATQSGTWNIGSITTLPSLPAGSNTIGGVTIQNASVPVTQFSASGWQAKSSHKPSPYKLNSAATTNATSVSSTSNTLLYGYYISNTNTSAVRYVKFYNKASTPTVGTDTPVLVLAIPASGAANVSFPAGINFTTGLAFAITTGAADSDTTAVAANEVIVNLVYAVY